MPEKRLRARQRLGKYRIDRFLASGGFASVYAATDTMEGIRVALKVPHSHYVDHDLLDLFRQEVRMLAPLDHPNILGLKDASIIDGQFVIVTRLGKETLADRLTRRLSVGTSLALIDQMLAGVAYAHQSGLIHCDIKPENFILFGKDQLRLTDFGIARLARVTVAGSGTGTVGFMSTEQAMGKPSLRSDVFSLGLIAYRMLSGAWPEYPFRWPPPNAGNLRRKAVHPDLIAWLKKSIEPEPRRRFADAIRMQAAYQPIQRKALLHWKRRSQGARR